MIRFSLPLLLLPGLGFAQIQAENVAPAPSRVLTLDEAVTIAVKEATAIRKAESDTEVRGEQVLQSYAQWLPNLAVQGAYNEYRGRSFLTTAAPTVVKGQSEGVNYTITSTLNIFNGLGDLSNFQSAQSKKSAADKTLERAKQQIALDVAQTYLQVILDGKLEQIAANNFKTSQDREKLIEGQTKVGTRSLSDLFRQQAQTSADQSALISARNRRETDSITLLKKLRLDPSVPVAFQEPALEQNIATIQADSSAIQNIDIGKLIDQALEKRLDYGASKDLAKGAETDVSLARAPYYPRIDFVASYSAISRDFDYQRVNGIDQTPLDQDSLKDQLEKYGSTTYGLSLTWTIFDRFVARTNVAQARGTAYRAKLDSEDYRNQVIGEVRQVVNDRLAAIQQLATSQVGLVAAQKAFEVTEGRFGVGALSFVDLSAAQTALFQAQASFAQSLIAYELQKRAMVFVLGG